MPLYNDFKEIEVKSVKGDQIPELSLFFGGLFGFPCQLSNRAWLFYLRTICSLLFVIGLFLTLKRVFTFLLVRKCGDLIIRVTLESLERIVVLSKLHCL